jgi:hypothetical protein
VQFIGISTTDEGLKTYLAQFPLPFPVYIVNESSELSKLDLIGTPQTIELSPDGKIQHNWVGAYRPDIAASIENRFLVKPPGMLSKGM